MSYAFVIYRHRVIKQADVVLAMFLLAHEFDDDQIRRNFEFYDPLTTEDSSLSASIQAIGAAESGDRGRPTGTHETRCSWTSGTSGVTSPTGVTSPSMGGTWMVLAYGLAGLRDWDGHISFRPRRPQRFDGLRFALTVRGCRLVVEMHDQGVCHRLEEGSALTLRHYDEELRLDAENPVASRPYRD